MQTHLKTNRSRALAAAAAALSAVLCLGGCSAAGEPKPFQMVFCANPLDAAQVEPFGAELAEALFNSMGLLVVQHL